MITIVDANIIVSAIISLNGTEAKILTDKNKIQFSAPDFLMEEVNNHIDKIESITSLSKSEVLRRIKTVTQKIKFVSVMEIPKKLRINALEIVKDIDENDVFYVALHLHSHHKIWTGDRVLINGLKKKGYDICVTTTQLKAYIYKK